ncbi:hypothetical protein BC829DRAFT_399478 [Chytridium lagenaria]|nr:hypothetical protein BC829DRAFT_399478 [Chytridium lagenaria]
MASIILRPFARSLADIARAWSHSFTTCRHLMTTPASITAIRSVPAMTAIVATSTFLPSSPFTRRTPPTSNTKSHHRTLTTLPKSPLEKDLTLKTNHSMVRSHALSLLRSRHTPLTTLHLFSHPPSLSRIQHLCRTRLFWSSPASFNTPETDAPPTPPGKRTLKTLFREYGPIALLVYAALSFTVFLICFSSITFLGVNQHTITTLFTRIKTLLGFKPAPPTDDDYDEEVQKDKKSILRFLPEFLQNPMVITVGTNILLAMAMTKLFLPIKLAVVVGVTPTVAKRLRGMGFDFGKMKYKDMANDAKGRIKDRAAARKGHVDGNV